MGDVAANIWESWIHHGLETNINARQKLCLRQAREIASNRKGGGESLVDSWRVPSSKGRSRDKGPVQYCSWELWNVTGTVANSWCKCEVPAFR